MVESLAPFVTSVNSSNVDTFFGLKGVNQLHDQWNNEGLFSRLPFASRSTKDLTFERKWDSLSPQVQKLNEMASRTRVTGASFFDQLVKARLSFHESTTSTAVLKGLEGHSNWYKAQLSLTDKDGSIQDYSIAEIIGTKSSSLSYDQRVQLATFVRYLTTGDYSRTQTETLLKSGNLPKEIAPGLLRNAQGHIGSQIAGGTPTTWFSAKTPVTENALGLFNPTQQNFTTGSYQLETQCQIPFDHGNPFTVCRHALQGSEGSLELGINHLPGATEFRGLESITKAWNDALYEQGLYSTSSSSQSGPFHSHKVYHRLTARLPSPSLPKLPESSDMVKNMLIPLGLCISGASLYYAKQNYESTKKSMLRKVAGCAAGIAGAALGVFFATIPFGALDN